MSSSTPTKVILHFFRFFLGGGDNPDPDRIQSESGSDPIRIRKTGCQKAESGTVPTQAYLTFKLY
jgi:hypothetical protein